MIILIDNKNFMIRYCEDEPDIHGFDVTFPFWQGWMRLLSDAGETVLVSGPEAEDYLDSHGIYYIHVESVEKESFFKFVRRLKRMVEENREFIESNTTFGKLMFAVTKDGSKGTVKTKNLAEVWRYNDDGKYGIVVNIDESEIKHKRVSDALVVEKAAAKALKVTPDEYCDLAEEVDGIVDGLDCDAYEEILVADSLHDALINLLAACEIAAK